jgi:hypothetical protein
MAFGITSGATRIGEIKNVAILVLALGAVEEL